MPYFEISQRRTLIDEPLCIKLRELTPESSVLVRLQFQDDLGQPWVSHAEFICDQEGVVDLSKSRPTAGRYTEVEPMGLFWSAQAVIKESSNAMPPFLYDTTQSLKPLCVMLQAEVRGQIVASTTVERLFLADGVECIDISEDGLVAKLFIPPGKELKSAALVISGSNGGFGWSSQVAALLASHGCAAIAVAYFDRRGQLGLPNELMEIPLEYFRPAIHRLKVDHRVTLDNLAVIGVSRGGELALLLGATYPEIKRVVAIAPSAVVWESFRLRPDKPRSSWSYQGQPLPFVPFRIEPGMNQALDMTKLRQWREAALSDEAVVEKATIPVEKIAGSILLISGTNDSIWPATEMCDRVLERLKLHHHPYQSTHLRLEGAGHGIGIPYLPVSTFAQVDRATHAQANQQAWQTVLQFLGFGRKPPIP